ncbi:MAG: hypothetical protein EOP45_23245 [Sphingobacteriaceae bacterium]|nr:MAG: hypothetical protein EOP45_23245 [Sphingobacteriaceae bacterium]
MSSPGIEFAQLEKAPDHLFLNYIKSYLYSGATDRDLLEICSLSSKVHQRCTKFKPLIQRWQRDISQDTIKNYIDLRNAIEADNVQAFDQIVQSGGAILKQYVQSPLYSDNYPTILGIFWDWMTFPKSVAMMDKILKMVPVSKFPSEIINNILLDPFRRQSEEQRQLHIKLAFRLLSYPGMRQQIMLRIEQREMTIESLNQIIALISLFTIS